MKIKSLSTAYIDGTNLYRGMKSSGANIDYFRFRKWLLHKYRINKAYIFIGYITGQKNLYNRLKNAGFELIFKESVTHAGVVKGNADAEMILKCVRDVFEKDPKQVVIISGDGDFSCLIDFLTEKKLLKVLLLPNKKYSSYLLRKKSCPKAFLDDKDLVNKIAKKRKDPL